MLTIFGTHAVQVKMCNIFQKKWIKFNLSYFYSERLFNTKRQMMNDLKLKNSFPRDFAKNKGMPIMVIRSAYENPDDKICFEMQVK